MRFLIDAALAPSLSSWLTACGHDSLHVHHVGMSRSPDMAILLFAEKEERIIVTADLDFPRLFALLRAQSPGLILFRGGNFSSEQTKELLRAALDALDADDFQNSLIVLDGQRIRRRSLPLEPRE